MNKWILILLLLATGAFGFWKADPLNLWQQKSSSNLLEHIPADTVFYIGGHTSELTAQLMSNYNWMASSPSQDAALKTMFSSFIEGDSSFARFIDYLADGYNKTDGSYGELMDHLGLSMAGDYAFYAHGAIPVIRTPLADLEKFNALVDGASQQAGWAYQEKTIGTAKVKLWPLDATKQDTEIHFAIATLEDSVVATLVASADDEQLLLERFGQASVQDSLANSGEIAQLRKDYGFSKDMLMFINFERLATGILKPESNSFGQDVLRYIPSDAAADFSNKVSDECTSDYINLAASMPRFIGGYTRLDLTDQSMFMNFNMLLELTNTLVVDELSKIRGHIPEHVLRTDDKLASFGFGIDVDKLAPALTALWTNFINAEFSCPSLLEAQQNAKGSNPAMLGMATGMAQGVKGVGVSIFDFAFDTDTQLPSDINALLSISAENPQSLLALTQMVPMASGIQVASDGTPTKLELPMLPPNFDVFAAIKGQHIAVYSGALGEQAANTLSEETLAANGIYSAGLNYRKLIALGETLDSGGIGADTKQCMDQYEFLHMMSAYQMDFNVVFDTSAKGLDTRVSGSMDVPKKQDALKLAGKWKVDYLDECQWTAGGIETFNSDGSGTYSEQDSDGKCSLFQTTYNWEQQGNTITMTGSGKEQYRENCDAELEEEDASNYVCHLMNVNGDSFQCLFDPATEDAALYRYTRM